MDKNTDYYARLGVAHTATADQIKKAYHQIMRENHPDKFTGMRANCNGDRDLLKIVEELEKTALENSKLANEAYAVLSSPGKKRNYDRQFGGTTSNTSEPKQKGPTSPTSEPVVESTPQPQKKTKTSAKTENGYRTPPPSYSPPPDLASDKRTSSGSKGFVYIGVIVTLLLLFFFYTNINEANQQAAIASVTKQANIDNDTANAAATQSTFNELYSITFKDVELFTALEDDWNVLCSTKPYYNSKSGPSCGPSGGPGTILKYTLVNNASYTIRLSDRDGLTENEMNSPYSRDYPYFSGEWTIPPSGQITIYSLNSDQESEVHISGSDSYFPYLLYTPYTGAVRER